MRCSDICRNAKAERSAGTLLRLTWDCYDAAGFSPVEVHPDYATALKRGSVQDRMLTELCDPIERMEDLDWGKADRLIRSELTPLELAS